MYEKLPLANLNEFVKTDVTKDVAENLDGNLEAYLNLLVN